MGGSNLDLYPNMQLSTFESSFRLIFYMKYVQFEKQNFLSGPSGQEWMFCADLLLEYLF